jgi:hypothetical protein
MKSIPRIGVGRATVVAALATALALAAFVPTFATGAPPPAGVTPPPGATVDTVFIKGGFHPGNLLRFVPPATAHTGDYLQVINQTNPHQVGPHTFALVTKNSIPKTKHARKTCFKHGHICRSIATWLGVHGNGPPTVNPSVAGGPGWDTSGSKTTKGDVWFTGNKPNTSIVQQLNVNTSAGPKTIYFQCAIHPFMHGSIEVLPPGA